MISLYGLKNCDTCRKASKTLQVAGIEVTFVDVRVDGVSRDRLEQFLVKFGAALVNKRSTTWRGLSEEERKRPPMELLLGHPSLMKRPVIEKDGNLTLGWTKDVQAQYQT